MYNPKNWIDFTLMLFKIYVSVYVEDIEIKDAIQKLTVHCKSSLKTFPRVHQLRQINNIFDNGCDEYGFIFEKNNAITKKQFREHFKSFIHNDFFIKSQIANVQCITEQKKDTFYRKISINKSRLLRNMSS